MKLCIFTLAHQAMPYIECHLPIFEQLNNRPSGIGLDWQWIIVHGPSNNGGSTKWCQPQNAGLSTDGTTEYLASSRAHDRITVIEKESWPSKDAMVNAALGAFDSQLSTLNSQPSCLVQIDADEIWRPDQLETIIRLFTDRPQLSSIQFACRYFVGPNLILRGEHCYGDNDFEWLRAWRYTPGRRFISHEPPVLEGDCQSGSDHRQSGIGPASPASHRMSKTESRALLGTFDHFAYATEAQCAYKGKFYGYRGLVNQWRALQRYTKFPVELSRFFSHVKTSQPEVVKI